MALPDDQLRAALRVAGDFLNRRRPPPEIRPKLDYKVKIDKHDLVLLALRPRFDDKSIILELPVAKMKWVGTRKLWRLFWMRADLKWHSYTPKPQSRSIEMLLEEVVNDPHGCFFG